DKGADLLRSERRTVVLRDQLRDADVRDDERLGRTLAHDRVRAAQARIPERGALASHADPETVPRGRLSEGLVHSLRPGAATGHARDQQREREGVSEETRREIDVRG